MSQSRPHVEATAQPSRARERMLLASSCSGWLPGRTRHVQVRLWTATQRRAALSTKRATQRQRRCLARAAR